MSDIVTIGIRLDPSGVVQGVTVGEREFNRLANAADRATKRVGAIEQGFGLLKRQILGFASVATALKVFHDLASNTIDAETSQKRLEGTLRATSYAAGLTAQEIGDLADQMQRTSLVDDEKVKDAAAILMSFRKIQGDTFREAIQLANDLSFTMGGDLTGAALQVGKALADPVQGIGALGRAGVKLTDQQEALIKQFIKVNNLAGAQRVIIDGLRNSFGGTAEGAHSGLTGAVHSLKVEWSEMLETIGNGNTGGVLGTAAKLITALLASFRRGMDDSPRGRLNQLADEIERDKRIEFHPLDVQGRAARDARVKGLTAQYQALERAIDKAEEREASYAAEQGERARAAQAKSDKEAAAGEFRVQAKKQIDDLVKALDVEAHTLGMSAAQARVYELRLMGASKATIALAQADANLIDQFEKHGERVEKAIGQGNATQTGGAVAQLPPGTPDILKGATETGARHGRYDREQADAQEKSERAAALWEKTWENAIRGTQDAFADLFENVGKDGFRLVSLFEGVARAIQRTLAQLASQQIVNAIFSGFKLGPTRGNLTQSMHTGGVVGQGGSWRRVDPSLFINAPRFHRGGVIGPDEVPIIAQKGERIIPRGGSLAGAGGGLHLHMSVTNAVSTIDGPSATQFVNQHGHLFVGKVLEAIASMPLLARYIVAQGMR